jgi:hypothetical protein
MQERRYNNRLLCAHLVEFIYRDSAGFDRRRIVNLDDISRAGACVQVDIRIPEGTQIYMRCDADELRGVVRYCGFREGSYFLGIEFTGDSRWSPDSFVPEHLLDPSALDARELVENAMSRAFN